MFVFLGLPGLFKDFFGAEDRSILQEAMQAIQTSKTLGMFDRANTRGTRCSKGQQSEGKGPDRVYGSRGNLRSLGSVEKGGIRKETIKGGVAPVPLPTDTCLDSLRALPKGTATAGTLNERGHSE